jgi:hypothetical protein
MESFYESLRSPLENPSGDSLYGILKEPLRGSLRGVLHECLKESFREPWFLREVPLRILQTSLKDFLIEGSLRNTLEDLLEVPLGNPLQEAPLGVPQRVS